MSYILCAPYVPHIANHTGNSKGMYIGPSVTTTTPVPAHLWLSTAHAHMALIDAQGARPAGAVGWRKVGAEAGGEENESG